MYFKKKNFFADDFTYDNNNNNLLQFIKKFQLRTKKITISSTINPSHGKSNNEAFTQQIMNISCSKVTMTICSGLSTVAAY
jgi:pyruvate/oxaloacetate carboxyltransferase